MTTTGLDGVVVADTRLAGIDGEGGRLIVAGLPIEKLAPQGFVATASVLARAAAGDPVAITEVASQGLTAALGQARSAAFAGLDGLGRALGMANATAALRAAMAQLSVEGDDAIRVIGAVPVYVAAWW